MELLHRAYELAFFLHRHEELALRIAIEALAKLEVMAMKQDQRHYYRPSQRRNKVMMNRLQLLQRLVYSESVSYEDVRINETRVSDEAPWPPSDEELTVWFIKHLVAITVKRNAFYVALGICRLLWRYSTQETMAIYDFVSQDPECRSEDHCYRSRKRILMRELSERFGGWLEIRSGRRGEVGFRARESSGQLIELVEECLERFTPWETSCVVPETVGSGGVGALTQLQFTGEDPDGGHPAELNRMHALMHPQCLARCARRLGLDPPVARLAVPLFRPQVVQVGC